MHTIRCTHFNDLTVKELYAIMALRQEVFIVEQNCPYLDADGKDLAAWHLMLFDENESLLACTRLLQTGISYPDYASIGRVVSAPRVRGQNLGRRIMTESLQKMAELFPKQGVKIGAQSYLLRFYESFGFVSTGENYLEDGIPHTSMILKK